MMTRTASRVLTAAIVSLGVSVAGGASPSGLLPTPRPDPAQVVPMHQIAPEFRDAVAEVIRESSFHHRGQPETFPCHPQLYLSLLNEPALTLALWQDLSASTARLARVGPGRYQGTDGNGTTATWQFVLQSPQLHVLLCDIDYRSPRGAAHLEGRVVLIVRTSYFKESNGDPWIQHDVEAFVKIDSRGWRAVARTLRPLIERLLEDQIQEAGWFVSLMGRLVESYPDWASHVAAAQVHVPPAVRAEFRTLVDRTRRPDAHPGRPALADSGSVVRR